MTDEIVEIEVTPQITKTDARDLKSLVRNDYKMLYNELERRSDTLHEELNEVRSERDDEDSALAASTLSGLVRRVNNLNDAIVEKLTELGEAGWTSQHHYVGYNDKRSNELQPHAFTVKFNFDTLIPPERDNSDITDASQEVSRRMHDAQRALESAEADFLRDLTLQSVTSNAARDFITSLPTAESLLARPALTA